MPLRRPSFRKRRLSTVFRSSLPGPTLKNRGKSLSVTWRALLIGLVLIPINNYWQICSLMWDEGYPTTMSLYFNTIFSLFLLTVLSLLLAKFMPKLALSQGELLTVYIMLCLASSIGGHDMIEVLMAVIWSGSWLATPENEWLELFDEYIPNWLAVKDRDFLADYQKGGTTLYTIEHIKGWLQPVLWWAAFIFFLVFIMLCINVIMRRQWIEREKLSYPIIQLPLEMTEKGGASFFKNKLMWFAFAIAGGLDILNGLHFLYPAVPSVGGKFYDIAPLFTTKPWNAIGWTPIAVHPFVIGLAFFIPLDLSFSCWLFYLLWKGQLIATSFLGLRNLPGFPYINEQIFGASIGLFSLALWGGRRHLFQVAKKIFCSGFNFDDSSEPMPYRFAILGIIIGMIFITAFCHAASMSIGVILLFFAIYFAISIAITRIRAELGPPIHSLHSTGPDSMLTRAFGTRGFGKNNLTMFSLLFFFNRAYRGHPMPNQLEGFKFAERSGMHNRRLLLAMILATAVGTLAAPWASLHLGYKYGGSDIWSGQTFRRLQSWLSNPSKPNYPAVVAMGVGLSLTLFLMRMRMKFFWWPLYPAAYPISSTWAMSFFWFSILISWAVKWVILKYGGLRIHRRAIPFFLGLILGQFIIGSLWGIVGIALHKPMYRFIW